MAAHLRIPAWDKTLPATLSKAILDGQLRQKLGYDGLIVTDALIMGGVAKYYDPAEIAVRAVDAGADILLMPDDPEVAIAAIERAIAEGTLSREQIEASLERIWRAKQKIAVGDRGSSILEMLTQNLDLPKSLDCAATILRESLQTGGNLPLVALAEKEGRNAIIIDDLIQHDFLDRQSPAIALPARHGYELQIVASSQLTDAIATDHPILLQAFVRGNPFRGSAGLSETAKAAYQTLIASGAVKGLIIYGSPYVRDWFLSILPPDLPWAFTYGQMPAAQSIACQSLFANEAEAAIGADTFL
jgi:beta-glucosidase